MALSRALKNIMRKPVKSSEMNDPLCYDKPAAKGKATKQYKHTGPKASGPNYRDPINKAKGKELIPGFK